MANRESIFGASRGSHGREFSWMPVSDLMSGLMIVFLFISVVLMREAFIERDKIKEIAVTYNQVQDALYEALISEFGDDLDTWNAEVDRSTLEFKFRAPDVLFVEGSASLRPKFKLILSDFFPRYLNTLVVFRNSIAEVRIEGHTSSNWNIGTPEDRAYFNNMKLSQDRTRSVLRFVQSIPEVHEELEWIRANIGAVGYSSAKLVLTATGVEDAERSRRVTFRVLTNAESQIRKIVEN